MTKAAIRFLPFLLFFLSETLIFSQKLFPPVPSHAGDMPEWATEMYSAHPNIWQVEQGFNTWRLAHPTEKTSHTQFYKKWRHANEKYTDAQGFLAIPNASEKQALDAALRQKIHQGADNNPADWSCIGPFETFNTNQGPNPPGKSEQANIYCFAQSLSDPNIAFCGTEGSEIFKTVDKGLHWTPTSRNYSITSPTALEIHPTDPQIVYMGSGNSLYKTVDGGDTWNIVYTENDCNPNDIKVHPTNPNIVLAATNKGLLRSTNGGTTWTKLFNNVTYDIEWKPGTGQTAYLVRNNPTNLTCEFYKSTDHGLTWTLKTSGWLQTNDPGRFDGGARLAVSNADPERVYAVLIGEAKTDDNGFIGIYRSNDSGENWTLPNPPAGGPWNAAHPNMATIVGTGGYHQGFYNLGFDASDENADQLLAGFLNLWVSTDGAATFTCIGGYCGNNFNYVHPDCQEIEINGGDVWMLSDGGVEYSNDFFQTHYPRNRGITGSDFWGFGQGWNEDVWGGGRYHNGNCAWRSGWNAGETPGLGGGEAATGYVNPGENNRIYFSDIGGVVVPSQQNAYIQYFTIGKYPNESYYPAESGDVKFDPRCWNTFYIPNQNVLWKTTNGGTTFQSHYIFPDGPGAYLTSMEISRADPNIMYVFQRAPYTWDPGRLWKSTNGGTSWNTVPLPSSSYPRRVVIALSASDPNILWLGFADGSNGAKIYKSTTGGSSWTNWTTPILDNESVTSILCQDGTNGGLYVSTYNTVFYRNNAMIDWQTFHTGLPASIATCLLRPFYKEGKIRMASYGKGVWESPFFEPSSPVAQPMVIKQTTECPGDTLQFDDYSILDHTGATWEWQFPGGIPSTANIRNPRVVYNLPGEYDVTLTVTNAQGSSTKTVQKMVTINTPVITPLPVENDFEAGQGDFTIVNSDQGYTWEILPYSNCTANGDNVLFMHNFVNSNYGTDELIFPINLNFSGADEPVLKFRVAYAPYIDGGGAFIDSMKVLVSDNCGAQFTSIFTSGGEDLSTTTNGIGPNNKYRTDEFTPANCDEWREICLDLRAYAGKFVTLKFVSQSGYGNNLYIDNLRLKDDPLSFPVITGSNTVCAGMIQTYTAPAGGNVYTWTVTGGTILSGQGTAAVEVQWNTGTAGTITVSIQ